MPSILHETFSQASLAHGLQWFCEPTRWAIATGSASLRLSPDSETDFWQRTHYGFRADNGHLLHSLVEGDFRMETRVRFQGLHQYDQAGLMVRLSPDFWLKTSVEFEPSDSNGPEVPNRLGVVVTRHGYSDWSTQDIHPAVQDFGFRVTRTGDDYLVEASIDSSPFTQIRLAHLDSSFPEDGSAVRPVQAGIYACSPKRGGFEARFSVIQIDRI